MSQCPRCSSEIPDGAAECPACGYAVGDGGTAPVAGTPDTPTTCPRCSSVVPEGASACSTCGFSFSSGSSAAAGAENPWTNRDELGFGKALIETVKMIVTNPVAFYSSLDDDGDWGSPILYACIVGWIGAIFQFVWSVLFQGMFAMPFGGREAAAGMMMSTGVQLAVTLFAPIFILIGVFIFSGLLFLAGKLLGDCERGFEVTFKVVAYTTTVNLLQAVPFCGGVIGFIWGFILYMVGLKSAHRTDTWKAILTPLLVIFICCLCIVGVVMIFGMGIAGLAAGMNQ